MIIKINWSNGNVGLLSLAFLIMDGGDPIEAKLYTERTRIQTVGHLNLKSDFETRNENATLDHFRDKLRT